MITRDALYKTACLKKAFIYIRKEAYLWAVHGRWICPSEARIQSLLPWARPLATRSLFNAAIPCCRCVDIKQRPSCFTKLFDKKKAMLHESQPCHSVFLRFMSLLIADVVMWAASSFAEYHLPQSLINLTISHEGST